MLLFHKSEYWTILSVIFFCVNKHKYLLTYNTSIGHFLVEDFGIWAQLRHSWDLIETWNCFLKSKIWEAENINKCLLLVSINPIADKE